MFISFPSNLTSRSAPSFTSSSILPFSLGTTNSTGGKYNEYKISRLRKASKYS